MSEKRLAENSDPGYSCMTAVVTDQVDASSVYIGCWDLGFISGIAGLTFYRSTTMGRQPRIPPQLVTMSDLSIKSSELSKSSTPSPATTTTPASTTTSKKPSKLRQIIRKNVLIHISNLQKSR